VELGTIRLAYTASYPIKDLRKTKLSSQIIGKPVNGVGAGNTGELEVFFDARWSEHGARTATQTVCRRTRGPQSSRASRSISTALAVGRN